MVCLMYVEKYKPQSLALSVFWCIFAAMRRIVLLMMALVLGWLNVPAQSNYRVMQYEETNGVPSHHLTQLLQDDHGFMWFSTWNGLCRYDGYEFQTFKPALGDGCHI